MSNIILLQSTIGNNGLFTFPIAIRNGNNVFVVNVTVLRISDTKVEFSHSVILQAGEHLGDIDVTPIENYAIQIRLVSIPKNVTGVIEVGRSASTNLMGIVEYYDL